MCIAGFVGKKKKLHKILVQPVAVWTWSPLCVCMCVCVLEVTHAGKRGKGGGPIYIGSSTRGNEQTSKRQQRGIVNRVRTV